MDTVIIRKSEIEDIEAVMDAHKRSIVELCSKDYSEEQIKCWSSVGNAQSIAPAFWKVDQGELGKV